MPTDRPDSKKCFGGRESRTEVERGEEDIGGALYIKRRKGGWAEEERKE